MGWGSEPHEGYAARQLADGTLAVAWTAANAEFVAYVAACSCGWRGADSHDPTEDGYEAAGQEWDAEHWRPSSPPSGTRCC